MQVYWQADKKKMFSYANGIWKVLTDWSPVGTSVLQLDRGEERTAYPQCPARGQKAGMVGMLLLVLFPPNLVLLFHSSTSANKVANQFLQSEPSSNSPLTHLQTWQHGDVETGKGNFSLGVWLALRTSLWCNFWPNPTPINQIFRLNNFLEHNITSWISW